MISDTMPMLILWRVRHLYSILGTTTNDVVECINMYVVNSLKRVSLPKTKSRSIVCIFTL